MSPFISQGARRRSCAGSPLAITASCRSRRVLRIWREMLAATVRIETPFAVAVFAPAETAGFWDLARDHYGSHAPMAAYRSLGEVIRAVTEGDAAVGILPMPREGDPDPWWRHLVLARRQRSAGRRPPAVRRAAATPAATAPTRSSIGHGAQQETGADRTLFAIEVGGRHQPRAISRAAVVGGPRLHLFRLRGSMPRVRLNLVEIRRFRAGRRSAHRALSRPAAARHSIACCRLAAMHCRCPRRRPCPAPAKG